MKHLLLALGASMIIAAPALAAPNTENEPYGKEFFQNRPITGKVTDEKGEPLAGVTVQVKGLKTSVTTNTDGTFSIEVPSGAATLVFSFVGMERKEVSIAGKDNFLIQLKAVDNTLSDVVVVGYGTQKKSHLTGSVGSVDLGKVADIQVGSLSEVLKGQIPGVSVVGGYSRPGEASTIVIRNPLILAKDAPKDPLFVIDDIIRTKNDFDLLDPSEVESINVLKDASAAIYGILGANGVVVVKTKRGKSGTASVSYSASVGLSDAPFMPKMMNGYQHAAYINSYLGASKDWDATATAALAGYYTPDELDYFKSHNYNWLDQAWQQSYDMRHALNISGGTEKATYFAGITYNEQNSNFEGLGYRRYSLRSSSDIKLTTGLKLGLALSANLSDRKNTFNKQGNESLDNDWKTLIGQAQFNPPYINGMPILIQGAGTSSNINTYHYFAVHGLDNYTSSYGTGVNFQGQLSYEVPFIKGLKAAVNYNKNIGNSWGKQYGTKYDVYDFKKTGGNNHLLTDTVLAKYTWSNGNRIRLNPSISNTYQLNTTVNYDRSFGKHTVGVLAGYEQSEAFTDGVAGMVEDVVIGGNDNQNFATGTQTSNETTTEAGRMAYFGRLNYSFANKYLFEAQLRADASQKFAPENRWGYFPSFSAGWVISEEGFFDRFAAVVNYFKIRGSVGFLGMDATKDYQWLRSYAIQTGKAAVFGGNNDRGLAVVSNVDLANRAVHWDNVNKYNAGIDLRFLRNRLNVSMDGYLDERSNMLNSLTTSPSILIGTSLPSENYGKANNFGLEGSASWRDNFGKNWSYNVTANFNWSDNKYILTDVAKGDIGTFKDPNGKSSDMGFYGYDYLGMFRSQADIDAYVKQYNITKMLGYTVDKLRPGMLYYRDIRGAQDPATGKYAGPDGIIDANDQDYLTAKESNHYGLGLNWGVSFKSLTLNVIMGMSWGGINSVEASARKAGTAYSNRPAFWADNWTPENPNAYYPNPYWTSTYDIASDFWWRSSFSFRVTSFNLAYTLPKDLIRRVGFSNARLYLNGTNPLNFYNPFDYKDNANGSYDVFPQLRTVSFGLNVNL